MPRLIGATIRLAHRADPRAPRTVAIAELGGAGSPNTARSRA
ncbi:hypothetical protein ACOT81_27270 [Streptomyces sp. WI04-05B]|nr:MULTISPECIES: hypothetical protein [unclassified Streptomyces]MDX2546133.1 hypothetical protein [Streptomyces sp. WI04-05B]MDX2587177.1 hypothetical protein [Streptomyces sp. WI04-05A]MDX3752671.1 hypothetical protein [Streptomyces sp. AK08-02]